MYSKRGLVPVSVVIPAQAGIHAFIGGVSVQDHASQQ
jgi:hypothetical protein